LPSKNTYIIIAVAVAIAAVGGGYWYLQQSQTSAALEARKLKWDNWAKTLYLGTTNFDFHPGGIDIGTSTGTSVYRHLIAPRMFWVDSTKSGVYNPLVGDSWTQKKDADGTTYIEFKLKTGWTFRDGTPINAENMKWNWDRALDDLPNRKQNAETYAVYALEESYGTSAKKLVVKDSQTLLMYTNPNWPTFQPFWKHFLFGLDYSFLFSKTMGEQYGKETSTLDDYVKIGQTGGRGPFYLGSYVQGERYTLLADESYPVNPLGGGAGPTKSQNIKTVVMSSYADLASTRIALETAEIDSTIGNSLSRADLPTLKNNANLKLEIVPTVGSGNLLHMNYDPAFAPLNDTNVRKAIQYIVDPQEIVDKLMFGYATVSDSPVRPFLDYYKPVMKPIRDLPMTERIAKAKELLTLAGYPNGFKTQFWYASGVATEGFNRDLGTILQNQMAKVGIELELKYVERGVYNTMVRAGELPMFTRGWTFDYPDPDTELFYMMHSTSPDLTKRIKFSDPHIDALLVEGRNLYGAGQDARRKEIYTELQDFIVSNGYAVPLYLDGFWDGHQTYVQNYQQWSVCDKPSQGIWNIVKAVPADWQTRDPPH
jgi:peptide/nickel transport system substrate-binding protein